MDRRKKFPRILEKRLTGVRHGTRAEYLCRMPELCWRGLRFRDWQAARLHSSDIACLVARIDTSAGTLEAVGYLQRPERRNFANHEVRLHKIRVVDLECFRSL